MIFLYNSVPNEISFLEREIRFDYAFVHVSLFFGLHALR